MITTEMKVAAANLENEIGAENLVRALRAKDLPEARRIVAAMVTGQHKHKCEVCNYVWEHNEDCAFLSACIFDASHSCPKCNTEVVEKYFGEDKAHVKQVCAFSGITYQ
jgi:hypothetical protein